MRTFGSCKRAQWNVFQLQWPLEYIVDNRFIETANRCVRFLLRLMRAKETLSRIHIKCTLAMIFDHFISYIVDEFALSQLLSGCEFNWYAKHKGFVE